MTIAPAVAVIAALIIIALVVSNILLWRKTMTDTTQNTLDVLARVDQVLTTAAGAGSKIATSIAAIQDAGAQIIAAASSAQGSVPQAVLDAVAKIDAKSQEALADIEILTSAPTELDEVTSALLAGAHAVNPVPAKK